jgi:hypothetical protein
VRSYGGLLGFNALSRVSKIKNQKVNSKMRLNGKPIKNLNDRRNKLAAYEYAFKNSKDQKFKKLMVARMIAL